MPLNATTVHVPPRDVSWDYTDCVVLVTGAAHGQGAAHAQAFAEAGAHLAICDIAGEMEYIDYPLGTVRELEAVAEGVRGQGRRCISTVCDVRRPEQVRAFVDQTIAEFGRIDVAVSNAGVGSPGYIHEISLAQWKETLDTNLSGSFYVCRYIAEQMIAAGSGRIVVTGSTQSFGATSWTGPYTASKHGLVGLVKAFAQELAPHGVAINLVCPTVVDTSINEPFGRDPRYTEWAAEAGRVLGSWNLLQEGPLHERDVTDAVLWLASHDAGAVSGTALLVEGGCLCK
jgi:NAD(P)-dependent dehydrogenase (short-subunit alcohol dehydrogenase family)